MRINIYAEELSAETQIITKAVNQELFYGVRLFLKSPDVLHYGTSDDDRTAITLWVPFTKKEGHQPQVVIDALRNMLREVILEAISREHEFLFQEDLLFKGLIGHDGI